MDSSGRANKQTRNLASEELCEDDYLTPAERRLLRLPKDAPTFDDLQRFDDLRGGRRKMKGK
jgi:hypothetical protein